MLIPVGEVEFDSGNHLHPSDAGYEAMDRAVNLQLFTMPPF